jgi:hypothetical protein
MPCAGEDIPEEDEDSSSSLLTNKPASQDKDKEYLFYNCRGQDIFAHLEQKDTGRTRSTGTVLFLSSTTF